MLEPSVRYITALWGQTPSPISSVFIQLQKKHGPKHNIQVLIREIEAGSVSTLVSLPTPAVLSTGLCQCPAQGKG